MLAETKQKWKLVRRMTRECYFQFSFSLTYGLAYCGCLHSINKLNSRNMHIDLKNLVLHARIGTYDLPYGRSIHILLVHHR